jgi:NADPH:quinone reductase-like Zn-dependent oxidoreductase
METYRAVMLTRKGGPEVLCETTLPLAEPGPGEVRIAVGAVGAGGTDVTMRRGTYPYAPKIPFVPGYEVTGRVEKVGANVTSLREGERVAGLIVHGGYAEKLVRPAEDFVAIPEGPSDESVVALILNYVTAWQAIHRTAKVKAGQTALVTGASGGVGSAAIELLRLAGVTVYGAASSARHEYVRSLGASPIESRTTPVDVALRKQLPEGVDFAFDGLGGKYLGQCVRATKRGGLVVGYGFSATNGKDGSPSLLSIISGMLSLFVGSRLSGRRGAFYGITALYRKDRAPFREDLPKLVALLEAGKVSPKIARRLPLLAAREANELLERGGIEGKIVHVA